MKRFFLFNSTPSYTLVASNSGHGSAGSGTVVVTGITAGVTLIVVPIAASSAEIVTDSKGNTYSYTTTFGSGVTIRIGYCVNPTTASSMTFTITGGAWTAWPSLWTSASTPTPALDQSNGNNAIIQSSIATGAITPTQNNELIIAASTTGTGSTGSPGAVTGYTLVHIPFVLGVSQGLAIYYKSQTTLQTENVTFAGSNMKYYGAIITSFIN